MQVCSEQLSLEISIEKTGEYESLSFYNFIVKWSDGDDWLPFGKRQEDGSYLVKGLTASDFLLKISDLTSVCEIDKISFSILNDKQLRQKLISLGDKYTNKAKVLKELSSNVKEATRLRELFLSNVEIEIV
jgi:hypothetical protein